MANRRGCRCVTTTVRVGRGSQTGGIGIVCMARAIETLTAIESDEAAPVGIDDDLYRDTEEGESPAYDDYRTLSKAAIASVVMLMIGLLGLLSVPFLVVPVLGILLGAWAWRNLRRYPDELSGRLPAVVGIVGSLVVLIGGSIWHVHEYMTEVPEGYKRISFDDLQPRVEPSSTGEPVIPTELDGQRVFVKGYVHPGVASLGYNKKFILVPDMGTCCFGGQPKLTDMIEVTILDQKGVKYSTRKQKLGGVLRVTNRLKKVAGGLTGGIYELEADYVN